MDDSLTRAQRVVVLLWPPYSWWDGQFHRQIDVEQNHRQLEPNSKANLQNTRKKIYRCKHGQDIKHTIRGC